jgi:hypothetical protein
VSVLLITWPGSRPACSWGPAAAGYGQDQRWILARVVAVIATMFHLRVSVTTAWQAMRRLGYSAQLPIHRAIERDEQAIVHSRRYLSVTGGERVAARASACICFADECGQALKAYKATTWAPKGVTPVVKVTAKAWSTMKGSPPTWPRRAGRCREEQAQTDAIPHRSDRRLPHRNRSISTIVDRKKVSRPGHPRSGPPPDGGHTRRPAAGDSPAFPRLQQTLGLTPGNLIIHLRKLQTARLAGRSPSRPPAGRH